MDAKCWPAGSEHLKDWAQEKPFGLFMLGSEAVRAAVDCHDLLEQNRLKRGPIWKLPEPDDATWFRLYGSHRRLRRGLLEAFGVPPEWAQCLDGMLAGLSWCSNADRAVVHAAFKEAFKDVDLARLRRQVRNGRRRFVKVVDAIELLDDRTTERRILRHPAMVFFLRVAAPLYLRHGEWPSQMLRRATRAVNPDLQALDRLVRNDRRVRRHPYIERAIAQATPALATHYRQRIRKSTDAKPRIVRLSTLKLRISGLVSEFAIRLGTPIEARELRDAFDRQAQHETDALRDLALPPYIGSYRREVYGARKHWLLSLPASRELETLKSVRTLMDRVFYHFGHEEARFHTP